MAVEGVAPHLAVGDDVQPGVGLQGDGFVDGAIFDLLEGGLVERSGLVLPAGRFQVAGP
jgi:hypothetical protein